MKYILSTLILTFLTIGTFAQLDRSVPPAAGPAPKINIGKYKKFKLSNGLQVFVVEDHKLPVVTYSLLLDLDPIKEGDTAGAIQMAGSLMRSGTTTRTKSEIDESIDFIGASLSTHAGGINARALKSHSTELLEVMSDVLLNPTFPEEELEKSIRQWETNIQAEKNEPSAIADNISTVLKYGKDDPYGELTTEKTLKNITREKLVDYHNTYFRPNVGYLVIVGDITLKEAKKQVKTYFGDWEKKTVPNYKYDLPQNLEQPTVAIGNRAGANQSTILVTHTVPMTIGDKDEIKASVMNQVLGGGSFSARLFQNLREDKAYTYGAYSSLRSDKRIGSFTASAQVRTSVTDSALTEILYEIKDLQTHLVKDQDLELVKNMMTGSFSRSLEDPKTIARFALNIERYNLPKNYYETYLEKVEAVTKEDVRDMAQKYLHPDHALIVAVGSVDEIKESMSKFSPQGVVKEYDFYGNEVLPSKEITDISAEEVIAKYIEAIGGRDAVSKITNITTRSGFSMQGMSLEMNTFQKAPNKILIETKMGENLLSKQLYDGEKGYVVSPMGQQELGGADLESMKASATLFPELDYAAHGFSLKLMGLETVDGVEAYKIVVTDASGTASTQFFNVESGLKIREINNSAQGSLITDLKDYQETDGVKFPMNLQQNMGPQNIDIHVVSIEVNEEIDDELFKP